MTAMIGDTVKVVRGRKVVHGKVGTVVKKFAYLDQYDRVCTTFVVLDDDTMINVRNCEVLPTQSDK